MDEDRRIRFLVAPTLFIASLFFGALSDLTARKFIVETLGNPDWPKLLGLIAGGGVVVFVAGYVIGTWAYFILRLIFRFRPRRWGASRFHEVALPDDALRRIQGILGAGTLGRAQELSIGVAFDYGVLRQSDEGVHRWLFRRWNAFSIATTSFWGLAFSLLVEYLVGIELVRSWLLAVGIFEAVLLFVMTWAWRDTMNMLAFMASLPAERYRPQNASRGRRTGIGSE